MIDQPYENDTVIGNMGATLRSAFFRKGRTTTGAYKPEGATLIGKLSKFEYYF